MFTGSPRYKLFVFLFFVLSKAVAQDVDIVKLYNKEFYSLNNQFYLMDSVQKDAFCKQYLAKAKREKDTVKIANGYYFFSELTQRKDESFYYADSIIYMTKKLIDYRYPSLGYIQKGIQQYYTKKEKEALESFLVANQYALKNKNIVQKVIVKHYIGVLKSRSNKLKESLIVFKENFDFIKKIKLDTIHKKQYFKSLFALSNTLAKNRCFEQAEKYYTKGLKESNGVLDYFYAYFLTGYGICNYENKRYDVAIDSLKKGCRLLGLDKENIVAMYLYIYKSYNSKGRTDLGVKYLLSIDSIYKKNKLVRLYARGAYSFLNTYYKQIGDEKRQLKYLTKLITLNSIIKKNENELYSAVVQKYDIPTLLRDKELLIASLEEKNKTKQNHRLYLFFVSITFFCLFVYFFRRNYVLNKRFKLLMEQTKEKQVAKEVQKNQINFSKTVSIGIAQDLVENILKKLDQFEKSQAFIKKKYTLHSLAKELGTNSSYLSKVINFEKKTNFANYLNTLKIEYVIDRLNKDKIFRSYTIKAIAEECGFSSQQTFSSAFYKRTQLNPSFFIKKINSL